MKFLTILCALFSLNTFCQTVGEIYKNGSTIQGVFNFADKPVLDIPVGQKEIILENKRPNAAENCVLVLGYETRTNTLIANGSVIHFFKTTRIYTPAANQHGSRAGTYVQLLIAESDSFIRGIRVIPREFSGPKKYDATFDFTLKELSEICSGLEFEVRN